MGKRHIHQRQMHGEETHKTETDVLISDAYNRDRCMDKRGKQETDAWRRKMELKGRG